MESRSLRLVDPRTARPSECHRDDLARTAPAQHARGGAQRGARGRDVVDENQLRWHSTQRTELRRRAASCGRGPTGLGAMVDPAEHGAGLQATTSAEESRDLFGLVITACAASPAGGRDPREGRGRIEVPDLGQRCGHERGCRPRPAVLGRDDQRSGRADVVVHREPAIDSHGRRCWHGREQPTATVVATPRTDATAAGTAGWEHRCGKPIAKRARRHHGTAAT